jgi:hypothetical protein
MKKINTAEMATPESIAADNTSVQGEKSGTETKNKIKRLTVVLCPPGEMSPPDNILEHEPNNPPRHVVHRVRRGDIPRSRKDNGEIQVPHPTLRELLSRQPPNERAHRPNQEKERQRVIQLALRKLPSGADDAPDDRCRAKHLRGRANEPVFLIRSAHIRDIREHPRLYAELDCACDDGTHDLSPEHGAWREFHVVAEFKVGGELERLRHCDVSPSFEHHHRERSAWEHVPDDELRDDAVVESG